MDVLIGNFPKSSLKLYFEILMDECSKNSSNNLIEHQWMPMNGWKTYRNA